MLQTLGYFLQASCSLLLWLITISLYIYKKFYHELHLSALLQLNADLVPLQANSQPETAAPSTRSVCTGTAHSSHLHPDHAQEHFLAARNVLQR